LRIRYSTVGAPLHFISVQVSRIGPGTSKRPGFGAHGGLKDTASTDVIVHGGLALCTFYQCGEAYALDPETLEQRGVAPWAPLDGVSAHPKVDEATGELMFFNYSTHAPFMHYGVVDKDGRTTTYIPVPLPGPRLPHDMAISEHYSTCRCSGTPACWSAASTPPAYTRACPPASP
jgi:carotenoid cleavage dioxygenase-like enzyme